MLQKGITDAASRPPTRSPQSASGNRRKLGSRGGRPPKFDETAIQEIICRERWAWLGH